MVRVGATVHRVVKGVDRAEPVVVREVEFRKGWPLAAYEERLHRKGWEIIIEATRNLKVFEIFLTNVISRTRHEASRRSELYEKAPQS